MDRTQTASRRVPGVMAAGGFRSGFVGIVGRPNVGKSTLVNFFAGTQVAIVSSRPQTTRQRILGVLTRDDAQVVFIDTPGFHTPQHGLGRHMMEVTKAAIDEADVLVAMIDGRRGLLPDDERVFSRVKQAKRPALLAINKVDATKKPRLLPLIETCANTKIFQQCVPVSALTGDQMDVLLAQMIAMLPEGPRWYDEGQPTDQSLAQRIGELVREQILHVTRQEVPQAVAVLVEDMMEQDRVTVIRAVVLVERPGQRAILIGRGGAMMKTIGQAARGKIEALLGRQVYLNLWVKVKPGWRTDQRILRELGYLG